jgi:hypothetical protein
MKFLKSKQFAIILLSIASTPVSSAEKTFESCYANTYKASHLNKHKTQRLSSITLKLYDGKELEGTNGHYMADVSVTLRGSDTSKWTETALCVDGVKEVTCSIECDGGSFVLKGDNGGMTLINKVGFRVAKDGCGETSERIEATAGNRLFRLSNAKLSACK